MARAVALHREAEALQAQAEEAALGDSILEEAAACQAAQQVAQEWDHQIQVAQAVEVVAVVDNPKRVWGCQVHFRLPTGQ